MQAKLKLSAAVLGTLLCAVAPAITHAESQMEWFQKQLQLTDGYVLDASTPALKSDGNASRTDTKAARGADGRTGYVGASIKGSSGSALIGNPNNRFSPYAGAEGTTEKARERVDVNSPSYRKFLDDVVQRSGG
jgi:outer membrane murein-binding lipoprotein Lpp